MLSALTGFAAMATAAAKAVDKPAVRKPSFWDDVEVSAELAIVSDYRRGGVSRSGGRGAIQGGLDLETKSGWNAGVWASTIKGRNGANVELELYGARTFEFGDTELSLGVSLIGFPNSQAASFGIASVALAHPVGPIDFTLRINHGWEQQGLGDQSFTAASLRGRTPIGSLAEVPLTLAASVGHAETPEGQRSDWSLSLTAEVEGADIGLSYVDNDLGDDRGEPAWVVSIVRTF